MPSPVSVRRRLAVHLSVLLVGAAMLRVAVIPSEHCPPVTSSDVHAAIDETLAWFGRGLQSDGCFTYAYDRGGEQVDLSYQVDDQQHVLSGLLTVAPVLEAREAERER